MFFLSQPDRKFDSSLHFEQHVEKNERTSRLNNKRQIYKSNTVTSTVILQPSKTHILEIPQPKTRRHLPLALPAQLITPLLQPLRRMTRHLRAHVIIQVFASVAENIEHFPGQQVPGDGVGGVVGEMEVMVADFGEVPRRAAAASLQVGADGDWGDLGFVGFFCRGGGGQGCR